MMKETIINNINTFFDDLGADTLWGTAFTRSEMNWLRQDRERITETMKDWNGVRSDLVSLQQAASNKFSDNGVRATAWIKLIDAMLSYIDSAGV